MTDEDSMTFEKWWVMQSKMPYRTPREIAEMGYWFALSYERNRLAGMEPVAWGQWIKLEADEDGHWPEIRDTANRRVGDVPLILRPTKP